MILRFPLRLSALHLGLLALVASAMVQFAWFGFSPRDPMNDVDYSIFAAQNLLAHGELKSVNMLADYGDDLAQFARTRWMVHFPPGHSLLFAAAMSPGLNPSDATKALALAGILFGGLGWIVLARFLGASRSCVGLLAAFYPWLPWASLTYKLHETEHIALAIMPWFCLALLRIAPASAAASERAPGSAQGRQLLIVILLALALVGLKYSMSPVFVAAALYLIVRDGTRFTGRNFWWKAAIIAMVAAPLILALLVDHAYGPRLLQPGPPAERFRLHLLLRDLLDNSVSATFGWSRLLTWIVAVAHQKPVSALVTVLSLVSLGAWMAHFRRRPLQGRLRSFVMLLMLLTITLWLSLLASTYLAKGQWNFTAEDRFFMPITLMWLLCCAVSLDAMPARAMFRSPAFYVLALPLVLTVAIGMRVASREPAAPAMPESGIAWLASREPSHASYLSDFAQAYGRKPDLLIGMPSLMNELTVPTFATGYLLPPGHRYWSSRPLELWALIPPSQERTLLANSVGAEVKRVATPAGYPFQFYIIKFEPEEDNSERPRARAIREGRQ